MDHILSGASQRQVSRLQFPRVVRPLLVHQRLRDGHHRRVLLALSSPARLRGILRHQAPRLLCHLRRLVSFNPENPSLVNACIRTYISLTAQVSDRHDIRIVVEDICGGFRELGPCNSSFILMAASHVTRFSFVGGQNTASVPAWPHKIEASLVRKCCGRTVPCKKF